MHLLQYVVKNVGKDMHAKNIVVRHSAHNSILHLCSLSGRFIYCIIVQENGKIPIND